MCQYIKLRDCRKQEFLGKGEAQRIWLKILGFLRFSNKKNLVSLPLQKFEEEELSIFVKNLKGLGHTCLRNTYYLH